MRKLAIMAGLIAAPMFVIPSNSASACFWDYSHAASTRTSTAVRSYRYRTYQREYRDYGLRRPADYRRGTRVYGYYSERPSYSVYIGPRYRYRSNWWW